MSYPQNPNPEIVGSTSAGQVVRGPVVTVGSMRFNEPPVGNPTATIAKAIAGGDTMEKRIKECFESIIPEQK